MARSDMFLTATGKRTGVIVGESNDKHFAKAIDVVGWSWGMTAPTAVGGAQRTGRTLMQDLKITKRVDKSSTALMSVMKNNEIMSTCALSVRKAGGPASAVPYFVLTLTDARIISYEVANDIGEGGEPTLTEHLSITFTQVTIDHKVQSEAGAELGTSSFTGEVAPA